VFSLLTTDFAPYSVNSFSHSGVKLPFRRDLDFHPKTIFFNSSFSWLTSSSRKFAQPFPHKLLFVISISLIDLTKGSRESLLFSTRLSSA